MATIAEAVELLKSAWPVRDEIVLCMLSSPGIGKTYSVYKFRDWVRENTEYNDCKVVEMIASQILPNEVSGITMPVDSTHSMEVYDHARLSSLKDGDILFLDELLQGSPQVLSAFLTLIQERRMMSGKKLPDIMIVAAANRLNSPSMIPESQRQRFMFVNISFDWELWRDFIWEHYQVVPHENISNIIEKSLRDNDTTYNTVTPRSVTKLFDWYTHIEPQYRTEWLKQVESMFGYGISKLIKLTFKKNDDYYRRTVLYVIERILASHAESMMINNFNRLPNSSLMNAINECKYRDEIIDALKNIKADEYIKEGVSCID